MKSTSSKTAGSLHGLSAHERRMQLITLRCLTREVLSRHTSHAEIEKVLAEFSTAKVRGDAVPTIAEGYSALVDLVNREGGQEAPAPAPVQPIPASAPATVPPAPLPEVPRSLVLRLEIRVITENATSTNNEHSNIIAIPLPVDGIRIVDSGSGGPLRSSNSAA